MISRRGHISKVFLKTFLWASLSSVEWTFLWPGEEKLMMIKWISIYSLDDNNDDGDDDGDDIICKEKKDH